jgi:transcription antitermination factor NusG
MTNQEKDTVRWYVVGTTSTRQELHIRDLLRQADIESYVPLEYKLQNIRGTKKRCLSPAITGLVFARTSYNTFQAVAERMPGHPFLRRSSYSGGKELLTVSDGAMERFIALTTTFTENITYFKPDEISLQESDKIRIKGGLYDGREGIIMRIKGKRNKHLVVQIPHPIQRFSSTTEAPQLRQRAVSRFTCSSVNVPWYSSKLDLVGITPGS